ncbi:hypothetical protein VNO78_37214 [Psophocarpus tetragonolobus]|uniref:Uncharacterized protein n=1 Tax=Psophocarpus tetragonolobus TaxID=3891 RepID=A0AAN9ND59_PSOTE
MAELPHYVPLIDGSLEQPAQERVKKLSCQSGSYPVFTSQKMGESSLKNELGKLPKGMASPERLRTHPIKRSVKRVSFGTISSAEYIPKNGASISLPVSFAVDAGELGLFSSRIREYLEASVLAYEFPAFELSSRALIEEVAQPFFIYAKRNYFLFYSTGNGASRSIPKAGNAESRIRQYSKPSRKETKKDLSKAGA